MQSPQNLAKKENSHKGFTLIELLVVIAIVTVLSVVVVLTLNPAELLRQSRDSNRISDLSTVKNAISLYLVDVSNPSIGVVANCYLSVNGTVGLTTSTCAGRFGSSSAVTAFVATTSRAVDGTGWIPVNFTNISSGSPLGNLPTDPTNTTTSGYFYAYRASSSLTYEINANMESTKFANGGSSNVESTDGGNDPNLFEMGSFPGLAL